MEILVKPNFNFVDHRKLPYVICIIFIILTVVGLIRGINYGVDFRGGTLLQYRFTQEVTAEQIRNVLDEFDLSASTIQRFSDNEVAIRTPQLTLDQRNQLTDSLRNQIGELEIVRNEEVGPTVGSELRRAAYLALLFSIIGILIYVGIRFELRPAVTSVLALANTGIMTLGLVALLNIEFDTTILAALLTVLGYSINDSIVVMDRIRERLNYRKREDAKTLINTSLNETLSRTIMTGTTTIIAVIILYFFGGKMLQPFALTMLMGLLFGTFSSIFIAAMLFYDWEIKKPLRR
ncbi:MAG TPA: protein translocase subunit SecF [Candidatus Atribacteria bacterium]|nr:protein translocase subunit SecF [Candidatus Atribacteria bacterium]